MSPQKPTVDLGDLQKRINDDPKFFEKFIGDPVATLKKEGLKLSPEMAKDLQGFIQKSKKPKDASRLAAAAASPRISIRIVIPF